MTLLTLLGVGTAAVVVALNRLDDGLPVAEQCAAAAGGHFWYMSPPQADNAALIVASSLRRDLPARAGTIALATALQESKLINITYGDRDSLGLFQQRPSQGWGTAAQVNDREYATNAFYDALVKVDAYDTMEITEAAQAVQRSAFPEAYAQHEPQARAWSSALTGYSPAALTCELAPLTGAATPETAAAVKARIGADLGVLTVTDDGAGNLDVFAGPLVDSDPQRATWATAQWAVAVAGALGIDSVDAAGQRWSREKPLWTALPAGTGPATGHVTIHLNPTTS